MVYKILNSNDIKLIRSRMDCGSFTKAVIKVVEKNSELFYIGAERCTEPMQPIKTVKKWKKVTIDSKEFQVVRCNNKPFDEDIIKENKKCDPKKGACNIASPFHIIKLKKKLFNYNLMV